VIRVADSSIATGDTELLVEHFYRELAEERAAKARRLLSSEPPGRSLARSAQWFELAAAALRHVITLAPADEETVERLTYQAEALIVMAARFEQSADIARRAARSAATGA
jgi:hypothetical protein